MRVAVWDWFVDRPSSGKESDRESGVHRWIAALATFSAMSAGIGAFGLIAGRAGGGVFPLSLLRFTPFHSFLVPGLLLGLVVGGSSLICAVLSFRRSPYAIDAAIFAGGALTIWTAAEIAMIRQIHGLHIAYITLGTAMFVLAVQGALASEVARHRWIVSVTIAESLGFLAPSAIGIASAKLGFGIVEQAAALMVAGLAEGIALGVGQVQGFPFEVRRMEYTYLTAFGASIAWTSATLVRWTFEANLPREIAWAIAPAAAVLGLFSLGFFQWIELRHRHARAGRWVAWTALAWVLALPCSVAPAPFVDETTPIGWQKLLWASGGAVMAYVMALITWRGVRAVDNPGDHPAILNAA